MYPHNQIYMKLQNSFRRAAVLLFCIVFLCGPLYAFEIAKDGKAKAVIVVCEKAAIQEKHAAHELADFLNQVTGRDFKIVSSFSPAQPSLLVGTDAARFADPNFSTKDLGSEGIVIHTSGNNLILAGGHPRGTLYAVYTFLEDQVGCHWWAPGESTIPKNSNLAINEINIRYVPPFEYRYAFWFHTFDADWAVRNKNNGGYMSRLDEKRGGKLDIVGWCHTFYQLIPPDKYFTQHPEWFSLIDGNRKFDRAQLCLTNKQMLAEFVKNLKERLRQNPDALIASVSQNDWDGRCQCDACKQIEEKEGSPSGPLIQFVNAVAESIEKDFPKVTISTLAYNYTQKPPKFVTPRANVCVWICTNGTSYTSPLISDDKANVQFRNTLNGWARICKRIYIWDYVTNFTHYTLPNPNLQILAPNINYFASHNVVGVFSQGAHTSSGAEMAELRAWLIAKLLWNPKLDDRQLINEFISGYYGPAGIQIKAYLDLIHSVARKTNTNNQIGLYSDCTVPFLSFNTLSSGWKHLKAAEEAVKNDPNLKFRVQVAQLPVIYTFILRWNELKKAANAAQASWPMPPTVEAAYNLFSDIAKRKNITEVREGLPGFEILQDAVKKYKEN